MKKQNTLKEQYNSLLKDFEVLQDDSTIIEIKKLIVKEGLPENDNNIRKGIWEAILNPPHSLSKEEYFSLFNFQEKEMGKSGSDCVPWEDLEKDSPWVLSLYRTLLRVPIRAYLTSEQVSIYQRTSFRIFYALRRLEMKNHSSSSPPPPSSLTVLDESFPQFIDASLAPFVFLMDECKAFNLYRVFRDQCIHDYRNEAFVALRKYTIEIIEIEDGELLNHFKTILTSSTFEVYMNLSLERQVYFFLNGESDIREILKLWDYFFARGFFLCAFVVVQMIMERRRSFLDCKDCRTDRLCTRCGENLKVFKIDEARKRIESVEKFVQKFEQKEEGRRILKNLESIFKKQ